MITTLNLLQLYHKLLICKHIKYIFIKFLQIEQYFIHNISFTRIEKNQTEIISKNCKICLDSNKQSALLTEPFMNYILEQGY